MASGKPAAHGPRHIRDKRYYSQNRNRIRQQQKEYRLRNRVKLQQQCRDYRKKNWNRIIQRERRNREKFPERFLVYHARRRAKAKGLPFDLKATDFKIPKRCPVLGIPLKLGTGCFWAFSPTLDRLVLERGYVKDNILVVSFRANEIRGNATLKELKQVYNFYRKVLNGRIPRGGNLHA